jgi:hypothetical protein
VAEDEVEESDLSDLEDWTSLRTGEESSFLGSESEEEEVVAVGKKRTRPHVEIEYETELEPRTKLKA